MAGKKPATHAAHDPHCRIVFYNELPYIRQFPNKWEKSSPRPTPTFFSSFSQPARLPTPRSRPPSLPPRTTRRWLAGLPPDPPRRWPPGHPPPSSTSPAAWPPSPRDAGYPAFLPQDRCRRSPPAHLPAPATFARSSSRRPPPRAIGRLPASASSPRHPPRQAQAVAHPGHPRPPRHHPAARPGNRPAVRPWPLSRLRPCPAARHASPPCAAADGACLRPPESSFLVTGRGCKTERSTAGRGQRCWTHRGRR